MAKDTAAKYSAKIINSSRELTPKERIMFKDASNAQSLNDFAKEARTSGAKAVIDVKDFVVIEVHNENSENKDYTVYIIVDKNGNKYHTSSDSFWNRFYDIYTEMKDSDESWAIELSLVPSKKFSGKEALICSLV